MNRLTEQLGQDKVNELKEEFRTKSFDSLLQHYQAVLLRSATKTHLDYANKIARFIDNSKDDLPAFISLLIPVFLTDKQEIRKLTLNKKLRIQLGESKFEKCLADHQIIANTIKNFLDQLKHVELLQANHAWYIVGQQLLHHYQRAKYQQGVVDFSDLEWESYRLLQQEDHALWVQYKLGARIHHFLVDEFQDTNPIQWHLLKPLVESSYDQHQSGFSSLFLVGDSKQSIYRFRGANPEIQNLAAHWSSQHIGSHEFENDVSWRSSAAIVDFINKVFSYQPIHSLLPDFRVHHCQQTDHWGRVEIYPLIAIEQIDKAQEFRNPLKSSRRDSETSAHFREGKLIAQQIKNIIRDSLPVYDDNGIRSARYSDILILTRTRSHLKDLQAGLRSSQIPFRSNDAEFLLSFLEIKDIIALLKVLNNPLDDIALVQVLKSPIFAINDQQLLQLRTIEATHWYEKLYSSVSQTEDSNPLQQVFDKLEKWSELANRVPVHDLLSTLFTDWNVLNRYRMTSNASDSEQICTRLTQFLHLSLEIDSGRYSSIARFLRKLHDINPETENSNVAHNVDEVTIMTVHGAKGLEAPIVFVADAGPLSARPEQFSALTRWPAAAPSPDTFMLTCKNSRMSESALRQKNEIEKSREESLNLLYVALTRAKQYLSISGVQTKKSSGDNWHQLICNAINHDHSQHFVSECASKPEITSPQTKNIKTEQVPLNELLFEKIRPAFEIYNPPNTDTSPDAKAGIVIHKCLEIVSETPEISNQVLINRIRLESNLELTLEELSLLKAEAMTCLNHEHTSMVFHIGKQQRAFNEISIAQSDSSGKEVNIIDRLIIDNTTAWIIDYKTNRDAQAMNIEKLADNYLPQLQRYARVVKNLYPDLQIRCSILFTKVPALVDIKNLDLEK